MSLIRAFWTTFFAAYELYLIYSRGKRGAPGGSPRTPDTLDPNKTGKEMPRPVSQNISLAVTRLHIMAHFSRSALLLLLALAGICLSYSVAAPFPCLGGPTTFLWGERSVLKIYNFSFAVFARYPDGRVYEDANVSVSFLGLQELSRPSNLQCYESLTKFPLTEEEALATPYGFVRVSDLMCEYQHSLQTTSSGAIINTTSIKATWAAHPAFQLTFNLSISDKDAKIPHFYSPTQDDTLYEVYTYVKTKNRDASFVGKSGAPRSA